jgi:uncharacterized protein with HEPN domain
MLDAIEAIAGFADGRTRADLDSNTMLTFAIIRAIEIAGEAASKIGNETIAALPDLPWPAIVGMRNRLIHAYFDVDLDRVWDTIIHDLPPLRERLQTILESDAFDVE